MNRFFIKINLNPGLVKISDPETYNQVKNVLRLESGEKIVLFDGNLNEAETIIEKIDGKNKIIEAEIIVTTKNDKEPKRNLILHCSLLKKENFETVVEKATEVGIKTIIPMICERTVKLGTKTERLEKIIKEASEQSGRGILPILEDVLDFEIAVSKAKDNDLNLFFDPTGKNIKNLKINEEINKIGIFIGPEGGWSEKELKIAEQNNFEILNLSKLTFRAETAAIVASYLLSL